MDPPLGSDREQDVDVVGDLLHRHGDQTAQRVALADEHRGQAAVPELSRVLRIALALTAQQRDHSGLHRPEPIERLVDRSLRGTFHHLEALAEAEEQAVRRADAVVLQLFGGLIELVGRARDVAVTRQLSDQQARSTDARVERIMEEHDLETGQLFDQTDQRWIELVALLEGPIEAHVRVVRRALGADGQQHGQGDQAEPAQDHRSGMRAAREAQLPGAQDEGGQQADAAEGQVQEAEGAEVVRRVEGSEAECDGHQAAQCKLPHQPDTRRRSKEKRASAIDTSASPPK